MDLIFIGVSFWFVLFFSLVEGVWEVVLLEFSCFVVFGEVDQFEQVEWFDYYGVFVEVDWVLLFDFVRCVGFVGWDVVQEECVEVVDLWEYVCENVQLFELW